MQEMNRTYLEPKRIRISHSILSCLRFEPSKISELMGDFPLHPNSRTEKQVHRD